VRGTNIVSHCIITMHVICVKNLCLHKSNCQHHRGPDGQKRGLFLRALKRHHSKSDDEKNLVDNKLKFEDKSYSLLPTSFVERFVRLLHPKFEMSSDVNRFCKAYE